ncbi:MAG: glycosyltransferase family 39 protein [Candidatus Levybacteria bacterium]|nr:glycosyltransferase family 39 protein [Candidatus Levybacteria bacterium]
MEKVAYFFSFGTAKNGRMRFNFQLRSHHLLLFSILLFAAFLRLYRIDEYMTFLGDEGRDALTVYNILHGKFTLLGPTASVGGFFLGPIYYYFMAPFLWLFNYNPAGPAVMVAIFGVATVWLIYRVGSVFFSVFTGLVAASLYTLSPVVIAYSRSSWNPNLIPFFSLLTIYTVYLATRKRNMFLFLVCGSLLGIAMQLHYLALFLGVIIGVYVPFIYILRWFNNRKYGFLFETIKTYILIFLGFLFGFTPFLAFEFRHGFPNIQSIVRFVFSSGETGGNSKFFTIVGDVFSRLFARLVTAFPPPEQVSLQESVASLDLFLGNITISVGSWYIFTLFLAFLATGFFLMQFYRTIRDNNQHLESRLIIFLWLILGVGLFGFYKKPIYDYYFGFMFPLPFLLVGNMLQLFWGKKRKKYLVFGLIVFSIILVFNLQGIPFRYAPNRQLAQVEKIAQFVLSKTERKPFNFALITQGNSDHSYRYFFRLAKKDPIKIETFEKDPNRLTVRDQLFVICETHPCYPLGHPLWEVAGFGRAEIVETWDVSVVKVYKLVHYKP